MKTKLFPIAIALLFVSASVRANVLPGNFWINPTFELGTDLSPTGTPDNWNRGGGDTTIDQVSTANSLSPTHSLAIIDSTAGFGEWYSDVPLLGLANAGDTIGFHWFEMYSIGTGAPDGNEMRVTVRFLDGGGGGPDNHFVVSGNSSGWNTTLADSTFTERNQQLVMPAGAVTLRIQLASGGNLLANGQYIIDDLSAYVVPEPSMIALLSVGGLFVLLRRKIAC